MAIEIKLRRFRRAPTGCDLGKFANNQRLDVGTRGFFVVEIRADVADMRIGQANDLASVAGIGEYFLIAGKTGIENDFAASAGDGAGCAAIKYTPVFERKYGRSMRDFRQMVLRTASFITGLGC